MKFEPEQSLAWKSVSGDSNVDSGTELPNAKQHFETAPVLRRFVEHGPVLIELTSHADYRISISAHVTGCFAGVPALKVLIVAMPL